LNLYRLQVLTYRVVAFNREERAMDGHTTQTSLAAAPSRSEVVPSAGKAGWAAAGGILGALAASSCCILPLALFVLGISGAWIGNLTALAPYQPIFFAATAGCLGVGYYLVYRQPTAVCADGSCTRPLPKRGVKAALWAATALVLAAVAFDYLAPVLLGA
jgi:mercuric ion transport protein